MSDTLWVYSLRGWYERLQVCSDHPLGSSKEDWHPAGTLAAEVLRKSTWWWPESDAYRVRNDDDFERWPKTIVERLRSQPAWRPSLADRERAAQRTLQVQRRNDQAHLRSRFGFKGRLSVGDCKCLGEARQVALEAVIVEAGGKITFRPDAPAAGCVPCRQVGRLFYDRDGEHYLVTPVEAVYLSAVTGAARRTLRRCRKCGRLFAPPRMGWERHMCGCQTILRDPGKASSRRAGIHRIRQRTSSRSQGRQTLWRVVSERVYRRTLRDDQQYRGRRDGPMSPEAIAWWEEWRLRAWNALLERDDLHAWQVEYANQRLPWVPKKRPGRPATTEKRR